MNFLFTFILVTLSELGSKNVNFTLIVYTRTQLFTNHHFIFTVCRTHIKIKITKCPIITVHIQHWVSDQESGRRNERESSRYLDRSTIFYNIVHIRRRLRLPSRWLRTHNNLIYFALSRAFANFSCCCCGRWWFFNFVFMKLIPIIKISSKWYHRERCYWIMKKLLSFTIHFNFRSNGLINEQHRQWQKYFSYYYPHEISSIKWWKQECQQKISFSRKQFLCWYKKKGETKECKWESERGDIGEVSTCIFHISQWIFCNVAMWRDSSLCILKNNM